MSQGVACRNNRPRDRVPLQKKKSIYLSLISRIFVKAHRRCSTRMYSSPITGSRQVCVRLTKL